MQRTARTLNIRVGEDKRPITLTDSVIEAVQDQAAGRIVDALTSVWAPWMQAQSGGGFASLEINELLGLRDGLRLALEMAEVLIECRPLDDLQDDDTGR